MRNTIVLLGCALLAVTLAGAEQTFTPDIPKVWDDKAVEGLELPLAQPDRSPRYMTAEEYYKLLTLVPEDRQALIAFLKML